MSFEDAARRFEDAARRFEETFDTAWGLTGRPDLKAFPARRHDERGWKLGDVVGGVILKIQTTQGVPVEDWNVPYMCVQEMISHIPYFATVSAYMTQPMAMRRLGSVRRGFYFRYVQTETGAMRVDVLVG